MGQKTIGMKFIRLSFHPKRILPSCAHFVILSVSEESHVLGNKILRYTQYDKIGNSGIDKLI